MVSHDAAISMGIHMFSLAIQEHVTIDKLALTDLFFLPHFNKPYNYITMAALTAEKIKLTSYLALTEGQMVFTLLYPDNHPFFYLVLHSNLA